MWTGSRCSTGCRGRNSSRWRRPCASCARWLRRSPTPMRAAWSTATSSRPMSSSPTASRWWPTSGWRGRSPGPRARRRSPTRAWWSDRPPTCRRSRRRVRRSWTAGATSMRWAACCTSSWPGIPPSPRRIPPHCWRGTRRRRCRRSGWCGRRCRCEWSARSIARWRRCRRTGSRRRRRWGRRSRGRRKPRPDHAACRGGGGWGGWGGRLWWGAGGVAVVAVVAALVLKETHSSTPAAANGPDTSHYAVLPFEAAGGVTSELAVEQLFQDALGRWTGISLVDRFQIADLLARRRPGPLTTSEAVSLARSVGAGRFVRGEVSMAADSVRVHAVLYDAAGGGMLQEGTVRLGPNLARADSSGATLVDQLLFRGLAPSGHAEAAVGTMSLPARLAYARGQVAMNEWNLEGADSEFAAALRHDGEYAQAALWLGLVRAWNGTPEARR